jgi:hypothetical protein
MAEGGKDGGERKSDLVCLPDGLEGLLSGIPVVARSDVLSEEGRFSRRGDAERRYEGDEIERLRRARPTGKVRGETVRVKTRRLPV